MFFSHRTRRAVSYLAIGLGISALLFGTLGYMKPWPETSVLVSAGLWAVCAVAALCAWGFVEFVGTRFLGAAVWGSVLPVFRVFLLACVGAACLAALLYLGGAL